MDKHDNEQTRQTNVTQMRNKIHTYNSNDLLIKRDDTPKTTTFQIITIRKNYSISKNYLTQNQN